MAGFGLSLKLVLYLQSQCLTESLGFLNPPLLQAAKRYVPFSQKTTKSRTMKRKITIFLLLLTINLANSQEIKYVNTSQLNVRAGAGKNFNITTKVSENEKVTVISEQGKWTEIETENGQKGFVSAKFLSNNQNSNSTNTNEKNSWITYVIVLGLILYGLSKIKNFFSGLFGSFSSSSGNQRQNPIKKQELNKSSRNNVVFRFRIKGNGSAGGVKYVDGMYVEIAVSGLGAGSPFNNIVEKLFVQEFARKYNIEPRFYSGIKMLYKRQYLDVEII